MIHSHDDVTILGRTQFRTEAQYFGIRRADRRSHLYVVGASGTGKSTLVENLVSQDIAGGEGTALLDPHGDLVERVAARVPEARRDELIYLNAPDPMQPWGFNPLSGVAVEKRPLIASGLVEVFHKLWSDSWGPRLEHLLRNALLALLDYPDATFARLPELLIDADFRRAVARTATNRPVRHFWLKEYEGYPTRLRAEAIAPLQNKVGAFLTNPLLNRILTSAPQQLDLRRVMDEGAILLVNLAKGRIGADTAALLGSLLVTSLGAAALARAEAPAAARRDFWVHLDEFHSVTTLSLASMLSELRKYGVGLTLAHQYVEQLDEAVQAAVFGNAGTMICLRVGAPDAEILTPYFAPALREHDLTTLPNHRMYVRLLVEGRPTEPFSAVTLPPLL